MHRQLPNFITFVRMVIAPLLAFLLWQTQTPVVALLAFGLFCLAGISDWLDGWLARRLNIVSSVGRMLDPIADKLLIAACILALAAQRGPDALFLVPALVILFREFLVSGLREYLAGSKITVPVTMAAKWKTAVQMIAVGCLILPPVLQNYMPVEQLGLGLLWLAALMTVHTGLSYFHASRAHFN